MQAPVKASECPNCKQALNGENYCPNCGQRNNVRRLTFWHFVSESLSNLFAYDGRFYHTLRKLFPYPGKVAKDYINGMRMRYMNPVRVYFLSSLILLFILQLDGNDANMIEIDNSENRIEKQELPLDSIISGAENGFSDATEAEDSPTLHMLEKMESISAKYPELSPEAGLDSLNIKASMWNRFLYSQAAKINNFDDEEFSRVFYSKIFWVLFLFLPIMALLLNLLYLRRKFYYPEHLFFTFYTQSVFFIFISIGYLLGYWLDADAPILISVAIFGIYLLVALKNFYQQSWGKTIFKFIIFNLIGLPAFLAFFVLAVLVVFVFI